MSRSIKPRKRFWAKRGGGHGYSSWTSRHALKKRLNREMRHGNKQKLSTGKAALLRNKPGNRFEEYLLHE